jgi:hypothetical protein
VGRFTAPIIPTAVSDLLVFQQWSYLALENDSMAPSMLVSDFDDAEIAVSVAGCTAGPYKTICRFVSLASG